MRTQIASKHYSEWSSDDRALCFVFETCPTYFLYVPITYPGHAQIITNFCPKHGQIILKLFPSRIQACLKTKPTHVQHMSNTWPTHVQHMSKAYLEYAQYYKQTDNKGPTHTYIYIYIFIYIYLYIPIGPPCVWWELCGVGIFLPRSFLRLSRIIKTSTALH